VSTLEEVFDIALVKEDQCEVRTAPTLMEEAEELAAEHAAV